MKISLNWLKEFIAIDMAPEELGEKLTMLGLEIEAMERPGAEVEGVVVGHILSMEPHPDADHLTVCKTDVGESEPLQIICGAKNMKPGDKVPTAKIGARLPGGFEITKRKMRGFESFGMMCSKRELGMGDDHAGLFILEPSAPIGQNVRVLLGLDDVIYEIEVTPNRNDWSSMIGVARELAARFQIPFRVPQIDLKESEISVESLSSVDIESAELCSRYIGRVLTNINIAPSPQWLVQRLISAGQRPINNIVDITNYVLLETGHPLHAFDYDKLNEHRIVVRNANEGEHLVTIDEAERMLTPDMLVIADAKNPVALAGIMGGHDSEVGESTTRVFLESAFFNPVSIRKTARVFGMATEASQRFQRGADPEMARYAIDRAAQLMQQLAGADIAQGVIDAHPSPLSRTSISFRYARANQVLGASIAATEQKEHLSRLGFEPMEETADSCVFRVPTWRHDCKREADLIEEVARLHGYEKIPATLPRVHPSDREYSPAETAQRGLRRYLVNRGLIEVLNMTFSSPKDLSKSGMENDIPKMVMLQNPLTENYAGMRTALLPGLLHNIADNIRFGASDLSLFEIGPVYSVNTEGELPRQSIHIGVVLTGGPAHKHWSRPKESYDFYDLKGIYEDILQYFGADVEAFSLKTSDLSTFDCSACISRGAEEKAIGVMGPISAPVLKYNDIEKPVFALELELEPFMEIKTTISQFQTIPTFPPSLRDLAVVVDRAVSAGDIRQAALEAGGKYLLEADLFDVYTGKQVAENKKSVALSLVFLSKDHTLTEKVTQKACDSILEELRKRFGAELR